MTTYGVVGAGIAGASVAYHLAERTDDGDRIVVFDRDAPASATTVRSVAQFGFYGDETQYRMKRYGMKLYNRFFADPRADPRYELAGLLRVATTGAGAAELERTAVADGDTRGAATAASSSTSRARSSRRPCSCRRWTRTRSRERSTGPRWATWPGPPNWPGSSSPGRKPAASSSERGPGSGGSKPGTTG